MSSYPDIPLDFPREEIGFMRRALALARRGSGAVSPNPMVGAVLVQGRSIVGRGWHRAVGSAHAEVEAIRDAGDRAVGATLFVTLEPCNHFGRTPPCTHAILEAKISRVVVAAKDPNENVTGSGIEFLRERGIRVDVGLLEQEARELNMAWEHWLYTSRPFVVGVLALSLDGKMAFKDNSTKWLSSPGMRAHLRRFRRHFDSIMIGSQTLQVDDTDLSQDSGRQSLRIVIDARLELSPKARVYKPLGLEEVGPSPLSLVVASARCDFKRKKALELAGVEVAVFDDGNGLVDFDATLDELGSRGVQSVLCEVGPGEATAVLRDKLFQRLLVYRVPVVIGAQGVPMIAPEESEEALFPINLELQLSRKVGFDALSVYRLERS